MKEEKQNISSDPCQAFLLYIAELESDYYPWYDYATSWNYRWWFLAQAVSLLSGFAAALLAAVLNDQQLTHWSQGRTLLVIIPILGSLASTYLVQSRIADLEALREKGRQGIQRLISEAKVDYAACKTPEECSALHKAL